MNKFIQNELKSKGYSEYNKYVFITIFYFFMETWKQFAINVQTTGLNPVRQKVYKVYRAKRQRIITFSSREQGIYNLSFVNLFPLQAIGKESTN